VDAGYIDESTGLIDIATSRSEGIFRKTSPRVILGKAPMYGHYQVDRGTASGNTGVDPLLKFFREAGK
jgi:hypothetical protein